MVKAKQPVIYMDHAAATPVDPGVLQAMLPYFSDNFYNASATYQAALTVRKTFDEARRRVARWLGARPGEIIFTAGGTEANNLAIHGVLRQFPKSNVVVSSIEHESVLAPAQDYDCREAAVQPDGRIDLADLRRKIDEHTVLVSVMYANNEIGSIQPLREVAKIVAAERAQRQKKGVKLPLYFHSDAAQAANYLDLHVARLGVDMLTLNGGKIYGPKQAGVLYVKAGARLQPLVSGGGQERNLRAGTENVAAAVGLAAALDMVQADRHTEAKRLLYLQKQFIEGLQAALPGVVINGSLKWRLPNNIHLTLPGHDNERLLFQLDAAGILAAAGSACSAANEEPSHVLKSLGLTEADARASLRFTTGRGTTSGMVKRTVKTLDKLV
jgi:cysteine desulfurase